MRAAVTPRTRAILREYARPTRSGKIFTLPELEAVAQLCIEHDLFLITDEIYEYFVYDGAKHICAATLPGMRDRTIVVSGFSKTYSITGWRVGYVTADVRWMPAMAHFHDLTYVCSPAPFQYGDGRRAGAAAAELLQAGSRRSPVEARAAAGCAQ